MKSATVVRLHDHRIETVDLDDVVAACRLLQRELALRHNDFVAIADKAGLYRQTVAAIAYGDTKQPRFNTVLRLLIVLGWTVTARR